MKYDTKAIMFGRKPRGDNKFKTAFIKFFDTDEPLLPDVLPTQEKDFEDIREVIIKDFEVRYLLEGNDILIMDIDSVEITEDKENHTLTISR